MAFAAVLLATSAACSGTSASTQPPSNRATAATSSTAEAESEAAATATVTAQPSTSSTACLTSLQARVTRWDAGAGSRMATVELKNAGSAACDVPALSPELVDSTGRVLIVATSAIAAPAVAVAAGAVVSAVVRVSNVCATSVSAPVTVGLLGTGVSLIASPAAESGDAVPPCNGDPGSPGHIEIESWGAAS
jgi:hypothetical protein